MKVLHLIGGGDVGGAKIHVLSLVKELSKHIDIKIISFRPGVFYNEAKDLNLDIEIIKTGTIIGDLYRVVKIINSGYEIVHAHGAKANMITVFSKPFINVPTITTIHSDYRLDYMQNFFKTITFGKINSLALRFIDYYIAVSKNFEEMLTNRNFPKDSIYTLYNGMCFTNEEKKYSRTDFFKKHSITWSESNIFVGILARLHPVKDVSTFLKAAKEVLQKEPSTKFLIGGDGEERSILEKLAVELKIEKNLKFLGFIYDDPLEFTNAIDINVLTSLSESFPYTILEGCRFKKATISSNVGGVSDLIKHSKNGLLFEPKDYKTLAEYMLYFIRDQKLRTDFGEKIFIEAKDNFSLDSMYNTQINIYESMAKKNLIHIQEIQKSSPSKKYDFLISGYYGSGNIGDDAILSALINDIRKYKSDARIMVLSRNPEETKKTYGVESINRLILYKILKSMNESKLFINGGGSLIQDIKSTRSLMYYLTTILFARIMGLKTMLYANGIGPIGNNFNKIITRFILNGSSIITLRDEVSRCELEKLHVTKPEIKITADPALTIEPVDDTKILEILENENIPCGKYVGFSLRKWKDFDYYYEKIAEIADYISNKYNLIPLFIPMHFPEDLNISKLIVSKMHEKAYILNNKYDAGTIIGLTKRMDLLIGMRLHALIFAASTLTPIIGIEYELKIRSFLKYLDLEKESYVGHIENIDTNALKKMINYNLNNKELIKKHLDKTMTKLKEKALENAELAVKQI